MSRRPPSPKPSAYAHYQRPPLYDKQLAAIFNPARYALCEASSKSGKSVGCLVWLTEQAMSARRPGRNYWWVSPIHAQAKVMFRRLKAMMPRELYTANESELTLTLGNGAVIHFKSGENPDGLYGEDVFAAVIDECSRVKEPTYHAVRTTLTATKGPMRCIGNVRGTRNWHWRMCRRAESGEPDMHYARITWRDAVAAGVLDDAEIADARRQLPDAVFRELYEAEASDDAANPFGQDAIAACVAPLADGPPAVIGVDLAKSQDWTVIVGLDSHGRCCLLQRFQRPWEDTLRAVEHHVGGTPALIDATGVGDPIVERLQRRSGHRIEGFIFTGPSKQRLMEGLAVAIQQGEVTYPDGPIRRELETFEYQYSRTGVTYSAPEGLHDDCVCALALAVQRRLTMPASPRVRVMGGSDGGGRWSGWG